MSALPARTPSGTRLARLGDAEAIALLSIEFGYPTSIAHTSSSLEALLASRRHFVAVAPETSGVLQGWLVAERRLLLETGEFVEITGLVVASTARRRGVGKVLVAAAEQWASDQGFQSIRVRSNVTRPEAHPFYESIGFVRKKTQHTYEKPLARVAG